MKKVFYILNLLFLTLFVFGGSVFAAAPSAYIGADGESHGLAGETVNPITNPSATLDGGKWYYLDISNSIIQVTIGQSSSTNPVNIVVNGSVTASNSWINLPENAAVNFYGAAPNSSLSITNGGMYYTIGNGVTNNIGDTSNFGNITFNSGTYSVIQANKDTSYPAIGSPDAGGGTITVNAAATVNARNGWKTSWNNGTPGVAVGVGDSSQNCTIQVNGGLLQAAYANSSNATTSRTVSAGKTGTVTISGQGKILSAVNPNNSGDNGTWTINSGIAGYTLGFYPTVKNQWAAVVGGTVTLPVAKGVLQQNLDPPAYAQYGCWNSLTVNPNGNLTLGAVDPDNPNDFIPAVFNVSDTGSVVNNYGAVTVNEVNQTYYPFKWNNYPGSTLTISEAISTTTPTLSVYEFNNGTENIQSSQKDAVLNVYGILNISSAQNANNNSPVLNNFGQLNISQSGSVNFSSVSGNQPSGASGVVNNPSGTVELDGTVNLEGSADIDNYGTLDIGPIGTVSGGDSPNLINEAGGTVT